MKDDLIGTKAPDQQSKAWKRFAERFGRGLEEVRERFGRCSERQRKEEIGQLGKQLTERKENEKQMLEVAKGFWRLKKTRMVNEAQEPKKVITHFLSFSLLLY